MVASISSMAPPPAPLTPNQKFSPSLAPSVTQAKVSSSGPALAGFISGELRPNLYSLSAMLKEFCQAEGGSSTTQTTFKQALKGVLELVDIRTVYTLAQQTQEGRASNIRSAQDLDKFLVSRTFSWAFDPHKYNRLRNDFFELFNKATADASKGGGELNRKAAAEAFENMLARMTRVQESILSKSAQLNAMVEQKDSEAFATSMAAFLKRLMQEAETRAKKEASNLDAVAETDVNAAPLGSIARDGGQKGGSGDSYADAQDQQTQADDAVEGSAASAKEKLKGRVGQETIQLVKSNRSKRSAEPLQEEAPDALVMSSTSLGASGSCGSSGTITPPCSCEFDIIAEYLPLLLAIVFYTGKFLSNLASMISCRNSVLSQLVSASVSLEDISIKAKAAASNLISDYNSIANTISALLANPATSYPVNLTTTNFTDHTGASQNIWTFISSNPGGLVNPTDYTNGTSVSEANLKSIFLIVQNQTQIVQPVWDFTAETLVFEDGTSQNFWEWLLLNNIIPAQSGPSYQDGKAVPVQVVNTALQQNSTLSSSLKSDHMISLQKSTGERDNSLGLISSLVHSNKDVNARMIQAI